MSNADIVTRLRETEDKAPFATPIQLEAADEIERLRGLLKKALIYSHSMPTTLVAAIEKEVSDECGSRIVHGNPRGVNR